MQQLSSLLLATVLLATALAGCTDAATPATADDPAFDDLDLAATADTGVIRGVVTDEAIRPLGGAQLRVVGGPDDVNATTTSSPDGLFGFAGLPPGTYWLEATRLGFFAAQQQVQVASGVDRPPIVKFQLAADAATTPYVQPYSFAGFIECGATVPVITVAVCSLPSIVTAEAGMDNITQDDFMVVYELDREPHWLQSELVWESTQATGNEFQFLYNARSVTNSSFNGTKGVKGPSPQVLTFDAAEAANRSLGSERALMIRVFNGYLEETKPPCTPEPAARCLWGAGLTLQQDFSIYTHAYYHFTPPPGWQFTVDGAPAVPA